MAESRGCNRQSYSSESNIGRILKDLRFLSCIKTCPVKKPDGDVKGICNRDVNMLLPSTLSLPRSCQWGGSHCMLDAE